ncbi:MAG: prepilin-type N-terminal cleavage/methylation domain-containing protein [Planctomycetes bacterium]|nr:prepilin-type N-terminal cleavage/methylation domain-containing protein [Planctomycetota bacterium]
MHFARKKPGGFTLIELMIVIVLIAIAAAIVAPRLSEQILGARVRKTARDFCNICKLARSKSAAEVKEYTVVIDNGKRNMSLKAKGGDAVKSSLGKRELPEGITVKTEGASGSGRVEISFFSDGTSSGSSLSFHDKSGRVIKVVVDKISGLPRVE